MNATWIIALPHIAELETCHTITPRQAAELVTEQTQAIMDERRPGRGRVKLVSLSNEK